MRKSDNASGYTINITMTGMFLGTVLLTTLLLGTATYILTKGFLRDDLRARLSGIAGTAAMMVDATTHDQILTPEDSSGESYQHLREILRQVRERNQGIRHAYTFRKTPDGKFVFIVDSDDDEATRSNIGDQYDDVTAKLTAAATPPYRVQVEEEFASDDWGTWLSSFAPILRADGSLAGIIGIDVSAANIIAHERRYLLVIAVAGLFVALLVSLTAIPLSLMLARPLEILADDMGRIQKMELDHPIEVGSMIREVAKMEHAVEGMKKGLRSFRRYVPADLVTKLIELEKEAVIESQRRTISILFSDIKDFTSIAEKMTPEMLTGKLERYFSTVTRALIDHRGTVDKFIGDAVMAFWGAPRPLENHAMAACRGALEMQRRLAEMNADFVRAGDEPFTTRIGLNLGEALVGNVGFSERMSYTALGDNVNLTSRIEGLNKYYGTLILASGAMREAISGEVLTRRVDKVVVAGRTQAVELWEVICLRSDARSEQIALAQGTDEAYQLYVARQWDAVVRLTDDLLRKTPQDVAVATLRKRSLAFRETPPADDWTGETRHAK